MSHEQVRRALALVVGITVTPFDEADGVDMRARAGSAGNVNARSPSLMTALRFASCRHEAPPH
jgi:hypothetical protein